MEDQITIDFFRPEDAPGVARLFKEVYGEGYPVNTYYLPDKLIEENAAGRILSSVARTSDGEVVGHDALVLLHPDRRIYENAAGAMRPAFRGQGTFFRVFEHSIRQVSRRFGVEEVIGEPVCNHLQIQKMCVLKLGYRESGLEVDLMPTTAYTTEPSAHGRVSVLLGFFAHRPDRHPVYLPAAYRKELEYLYAGLEVEREFVRAPDRPPMAGETRGGMEVYAGAQVARFLIEEVGTDFEQYLARQEGEARVQGVQVFQAWLPLSSPLAETAVERLRDRGYFIGGVLPRWLDQDTLLMQKVTISPDWEGIQLYSERAKRIGEIVRRDWESLA